MSLVPARLPIRTAAALAGRSEPAFRRDVLPAVQADDGRVSLTGLQHYLEREIGPADYLAACMKLEGRRARERRYKAGSDAAA